MDRSSDKCNICKHKMFKRPIEIWKIVVVFGIFKYIKPNLWMSYIFLGLSRDYIPASIGKYFLKELGWVEGNWEIPLEKLRFMQATN